jgi:dTDP-4-amino-4,6-dideoxygalactose transaminase
MRVLDRGVLSGASAPESTALEAEFGEYVQAKHCLLTHCGTSALHLALAAAGIRGGDHVLVPAYSFIATALAVVHAGAIPIFVDVDPRTGLIDPALVGAAITPRTRAIMPVHVHGCPADLGALSEIAARHRLLVIEDAAQAHGATYGGRPVGALGAAGGFSLQSSKNLGVGEGGLVVTNDAALAEEVHRIRNFGLDVSLADRDAFDEERPLDGGRPLESQRIGWMYRGNELTAALARSQLRLLRARTERCQSNAERLSRRLAELPGVLPPHVPEGRTSVHHKFRVILDGAAAGVSLSPRRLRDVVMKALRAEGLEVVMWQADVMPAHPAFQKREGFGAGFPWSADRETDFAALYAPARFANARGLLDRSLVLFSQSCPLIAQSAETVDRYAEAFARVWAHRADLERWA